MPLSETPMAARFSLAKGKAAVSGFETTRWSLIIETRHDDAAARWALEELCRRYRGPVLGYLRAHGYPKEEADDQTQAFFAHLLSQKLHHSADPAKGRFRSYLLMSLQHFLSSERRRERAEKRGGLVEHVGLDSVAEPVSADTPELAFEREWARSLLAHALHRLREEARQAGKETLFQALRNYLFESPGAEDYAETSRSLGLSRNTVAVAVHRLRHRLQELVQQEVACTLADETQLPEELASLQDRIKLGPTAPL